MTRQHVMLLSCTTLAILDTEAACHALNVLSSDTAYALQAGLRLLHGDTSAW